MANEGGEGRTSSSSATADDFVIGFERREKRPSRCSGTAREIRAVRSADALESKTRLLEFGRFSRPTIEGDAASDFPTRRRSTFSGSRTFARRRRKGGFTVLRQTMRKRWQAKLKAVKTELKARMHDPIPEVGTYLRAVVLGHVRYYGVPMNGPALCAFRRAVGMVWWRVLRRRTQGNHFPLRRMWPLLQTWLPPARICHPYPSQRLRVTTRGGSRMRNAARPDLWRGWSAMIISTPTSSGRLSRPRIMPLGAPMAKIE